MFTNCKVCGRRLRSELSRELGIGPICGHRETVLYGKTRKACK